MRCFVLKELLWADITEELHFETANGRLANVDIHKDDRSRCGH
jgi:hypothetical protein